MKSNTPRAGYTVALTIGGLPIVAETENTPIRTPADARAALPNLAMFAQEAFAVLTLNRKNRLLGRHVVTLGLADASLVHPREVFRQAILDNACSIVLAHNHPSGDPTPSAEDVRITRQLVDAGRIIGIQVIDHVVIGRGATPLTSLREAGLIAFE